MRMVVFHTYTTIFTIIMRTGHCPTWTYYTWDMIIQNIFIGILMNILITLIFLHKEMIIMHGMENYQKLHLGEQYIIMMKIVI